MPCRPFSLKLHPVSCLFRSKPPALSWRGVFSGKRCTSSQVLPQLGSPYQISTYFKYQSQPISTSLPRGQNNNFWVPSISVVRHHHWGISWLLSFSQEKKAISTFFINLIHPQPKETTKWLSFCTFLCIIIHRNCLTHTHTKFNEDSVWLFYE